MIAGNVKEVCGCDLARIGNKGLAHHRCLRRSHCGLEQSHIANSSRAAMGGEDFIVNRFDGVDREML